MNDGASWTCSKKVTAHDILKIEKLQIFIFIFLLTYNFPCKAITYL